MTAHDLRKETLVTISTKPVDTAPTLSGDTDPRAANVPTERTPSSNTEAVRSRAIGDPRALLAARLLASLALVVSALVHARLATQLGMDGPLLAQSHLFVAHALMSSLLAVLVLSNDDRVWLVALVLAVAGLGAILASVYFPVPSIGPFPGFKEPTWLLSKAIVAFAEFSVVVLWAVRQIAPAKPR
jgi:hypothetical protein